MAIVTCIDIRWYTDIFAYLCSCTSRDVGGSQPAPTPGNHRVLCRNCATETRPHWNTRPLGLCFLCRCPWDDITLVSDHDINIWRWECGRTPNRFWHHELAACSCATFWSDTLKIFEMLESYPPGAAWSCYLDTDLGSTDKLKYRWKLKIFQWVPQFRNLSEVVVWQGGLLAFNRLAMQRCQL